MKKAIYLKVNRACTWAMDNIHRWLKISITLGYDTFIVCDKPDLKEKIEELEFSMYAHFIKSIIREPSSSLVKSITVPRWNAAAYAHLTTLIHPKDKGYDYVWNIDADDTFVCLPVDRAVELLTRVENYAQEKSIDFFSLDMWYSRLNGDDWSFGITYQNCKTDWVEVIKENSVNYVTDEISHGNIDNFFFHLREIKAVNIETWYAENLVFAHYSDDFLKCMVQSGLYHWKSGKELSPISSIFPDIDKVCRTDIQNDVVKIDIGITDHETAKTLLYYSGDGHLRNRYGGLVWGDVEGKKIVDLRQKSLNKTVCGDEDVTYVVFGTGEFFNKNISRLQIYNRIGFVSDNDSQKWGKSYKGLQCISPEQLKKIKCCVVIIMVFSEETTKEISKQLGLMNISSIPFKMWEKNVYKDDEFI